MDGRIAPSLVEEASRTVEVLEIVLVRLAPPELHVSNLKVAPEVAGGEALGLSVVLRPPDVIDNPLDSAVLVQIARVVGQEFGRLGPQGGQSVRIVVEVQGEAVRLVVVLHVAEDVVVDIAEEMDLGLDAPVVADVLERGMLVEHAAVPATHLMVGHHVGILNTVLLKHGSRFFEDAGVDPRGRVPVVIGDELCVLLLVSRASCERTSKSNIP